MKEQYALQVQRHTSNYEKNGIFGVAAAGKVDSADLQDSAVELRGALVRPPSLSLGHLTLVASLTRSFSCFPFWSFIKFKKYCKKSASSCLQSLRCVSFLGGDVHPIPTCSWLIRLETRCFSLFGTTLAIKTCGLQSLTLQPCGPRTG